MLSRGLFQRPYLVNGWQATAWRDERSEPPEASPTPGRVQGRHKHHHGYLRSKLSGRGHGIFCNWLIIKYHFNSSVETQAFFGHVSTPCFITHWKSKLPKTKRGRIPPNYNFVLWRKTDKNHKLIFRKNHETHKNLPRDIKIIKICIPVPTFPMFSDFFCILLQPWNTMMPPLVWHIIMSNHC